MAISYVEKTLNCIEKSDWPVERFSIAKLIYNIFFRKFTKNLHKKTFYICASFLLTISKSDDGKTNFLSIRNGIRNRKKRKKELTPSVLFRTPEASSFWCTRRDLNPYAARHWNLNPTCLPIPPRVPIQLETGVRMPYRLQEPKSRMSTNSITGAYERQGDLSLFCCPPIFTR